MLDKFGNKKEKDDHSVKKWTSCTHIQRTEYEKCSCEDNLLIAIGNVLHQATRQKRVYSSFTHTVYVLPFGSQFFTCPPLDVTN